MAANPYGWKHSVPHAYWGYYIDLAVFSSTVYALLPVLPPTNEPFQSLSFPGDLYTHGVACRETWPTKTKWPIFTTFTFMVQYCVPLSFNLICYSKTVTCLHRRNEKENSTRETESQLNENKRINTMLISTVVTFGACWLPLNTLGVIFDWCHEVLMICHHDLIFVTCHLIAMISTCINPLFYGFLNKNFQKDLEVLIYHCWCFVPQDRYRKCCHLHYAQR